MRFDNNQDLVSSPNFSPTHRLKISFDSDVKDLPTVESDMIPFSPRSKNKSINLISQVPSKSLNFEVVPRHDRSVVKSKNIF